MTARQWLAAALFALGGAAVTVGVWLTSPAAGLIAAGLLLLAWTFVVVVEWPR